MRGKIKLQPPQALQSHVPKRWPELTIGHQKLHVINQLTPNLKLDPRRSDLPELQAYPGPGHRHTHG